LPTLFFNVGPVTLRASSSNATTTASVPEESSTPELSPETRENAFNTVATNAAVGTLPREDATCQG
jgi:hypothetical protein